MMKNIKFLKVLIFETLQKNCSNATQLCLQKVTLALSGRYSCEVSADSPSFKTALVSGYMDVVGKFHKTSFI